MHNFRTSEYVGLGHPDKVADQISDTILDLYLEKDPNSRVAVETLVSGNNVFLAGEISSKETIHNKDIRKAIRNTLHDIGYKSNLPGNFHHDDVDIQVYLKPQSTNIHSGVDKEDGQVGAGDQGIMFGYATEETPELLPLPYVIAADLLNVLNAQILEGTLPNFYTDNKSQVCIDYYNGQKYIHEIILSSWHDPSLEIEEVRDILRNKVVNPIYEKYEAYIPGDVLPIAHINSAGPFFIGGPTADAGVTGRKIIVDTYGGFAPHGGGAFSGKDPSKVDRSATYMARHVAKSLVANGYATEALVQLSYAIGHTQPFSIHLESDSGRDEELIAKIRQNFDLSPKGIINYLKLNDPNTIKYKNIASGGHFLNQTAPWEQIKEF